MGTSSRKKIPRLQDEIDKIKYDENNNISLEDFKLLLSKLLFPRGRKSIQSEKIVNSASTYSFTKSIKKIIKFSGNYKSLGVIGFGINKFESYSFDEQVDLIADTIVESENPELKQSIKDIIYANGIDGTFSNTFLLILGVLKKYIERSIQGSLVEEFAQRNEEFTDENFDKLLDSAITESIIRIVTVDKVNDLILNYENEPFISKWADDNITLILKGATV